MSLVGLVALTVVASSSADPPFIAQGQISGASTDGNFVLPVDDPDGLLIKITNPNPTDHTCLVAGSVAWFYLGLDVGPFKPGDEITWLTDPNDSPWFSTGATWGAALPPTAPFAFSGVMPDGEACSAPGNSFLLREAVAFVVPADNTYDLNFGLTSGAYSYTLFGPLDGNGQGTAVGGSTITSPGTVKMRLARGLYQLALDEGTNGTTSWSINGNDEPPTLNNAHATHTVTHPAAGTQFVATTSESGSLEADVLRGGAVIRSLVSTKNVGIGQESVLWDGRLGDGTPAPNGSYVVRMTETDWQKRTVTEDFPLTISDGSPTAVEAAGIRAGVRSDWCNGIRHALGAKKAGKCSSWILHINNIHVSIIDRLFAKADNLAPRRRGQPAYQGGTVLLKRVGARWLVTEAFTDLAGQSCAHTSHVSGIPTSSLHDLKVC